VRIADVLRGKGSSVATVDPSASVAELVASLAEHNVGALPVIEAERLVGIVSERDVVRHLHERGADLLTAPVADIMTTVVATCRADEDVQSLSRTMTERRIRHVPVVTDGRLTGIISIGDVVKSSLDQLQFERDQLDSYVHQT